MSTPSVYPLFKIAGDSGLIIEFGDKLDLAVNNAVQCFDARLSSESIAGVSETAPTLRSVLVRFDPLIISFNDLQVRLELMLSERDWCNSPVEQQARHWRIPVLYGDEDGNDLEDVASLVGLSVEDAIAQHCQCVQRVLTLGFSPGFTYLGLLPDNWNLPRLDYVKPLVPAGAISVAVCQSVMTSTPIPTGWRTIGRTPFNNFNLRGDPVFTIGAGDEISFYPIDRVGFNELQRQVEAGESIAGNSC